MSKKLTSFAALGLTVGASAFAAAHSVPNEILVKFKAETLSAQTLSGDFKESQLRAVDLLNNSSFAARDLGALSAVRGIRSNVGVVRFASNMSAIEAARALRQDPRVAWAQPNYIMSVKPFMEKSEEIIEDASIFSAMLAAPKKLLQDPSLISAPALPNPAVADPDISKAWGLSKIEATNAWKTQKGSKQIVVADIDTGIDYTHEDLVNNLWQNPNVDPKLNDKIGYDFANHDSLPYDDQMHGTHTAGTIGAVGGNGKGVSGVAQSVSIMALKFITAEGFGTTADAVSAIDYAIAHGARVMSNSWGGESDQGEEDKMLVEAVKRAGKADILFVAAAGNDGTDNDTRPMYPAAITEANVLTVASSTSADGKSFFSNTGAKTVHVAAPGSNVYSTQPGNKYQQLSGTSMACPHVAGLAALILSQRPELSAVQVKQIIMDTVDPLSAFQGKIVTGGRVNARAALQKAAAMGI